MSIMEWTDGSATITIATNGHEVILSFVNVDGRLTDRMTPDAALALAENLRTAARQARAQAEGETDGE